MINRITGLDAPTDGLRDRPNGFFVPDPAAKRPSWSELGGRVEKFIGDHPVASLAIGLTVGIVIGCLVKRR